MCAMCCNILAHTHAAAGSRIAVVCRYGYSYSRSIRSSSNIETIEKGYNFFPRRA